MVSGTHTTPYKTYVEPIDVRGGYYYPDNVCELASNHDDAIPATCEVQ